MRSPLFILAVLAVVACDAPAIEWGDPVTIPAAPGSRLVVDSSGTARFVADSSPKPSITGTGVCPNSVRAAWGTTRLRAVWWELRADSSAALYMAASADSGRSWEKPVSVDSADVSAIACRRPAPAVFAQGDDLHIAYSMTASEGTGVFFAHFLSSMVHSPVAVIYGDHVVPTAIAADGERIAVAYEDPNGKRRQVAVALSSTQGHIFEAHAIASRDVDVAGNPAIALAGHEIAVAWSPAAAADSGSTRIVRRGRIR
jgi:hypothetical protein